MVKEVLSTRVSADIAAAVRARAEGEGLKLSEVVEKALVTYLGLGGGDSDDGPNLAERLAEIEQRLSRIEAKGQCQAAGRMGKGRR